MLIPESELLYCRPGINLNYIEGPKNGSPLLLLHGNVGRWQAFTPIIPDLISKYHVFAVDFRGHGKSSHVPGSYTLENHLLDVIAFINEKIKSPVTLFGISLGGMVSLMAAARYPQLIQNVIVADPPLTLETLSPFVEAQKDFGRRVIGYLQTQQLDKVREALNDEFAAESCCACDPDVLISTFERHAEMMAGYSLDTLFPQIKCPLLMMRGEESLGSMITDKDMSKARELLPTLTEQKIAGVGHSVLMNKESVLQTVIQFLVNNRNKP